MKKILYLFLIVFIIAGCGKTPESKLEIKDNVYNLVINGNNHTFKIEVEDTPKELKKVTLLMDDKEISNYQSYYYQGESSDLKKGALLKGKDNKSYFVFAVGSWDNSHYSQRMYIFDDTGKVIESMEKDDFGVAFTDYSSVESFSMDSLYGNTGMFKIEEDQITYLDQYSYTPGDDFVRCQEIIITVDNGKITETLGKIIKVAIMA